MLAKSTQALSLYLVKTVGEGQLDITSDPKFLPQESNKENAIPFQLWNGCPGGLEETHSKEQAPTPLPTLSKPLYSTHCVPGTVLSTAYVLAQWSPSTALWGRSKCKHL